MQELNGLVARTYDNFNKSLVLLSHEYRSLAPQCEALEQTKGKLRTYLLTQPNDLIELMNVVNVGSEFTLIGLPHRPETLPVELQLSIRLKVLLPSDYFRDLYRKVSLTDFIRYDTSADIDNILSQECDPTIYNIVVTTEGRLAETSRFPLLYDNTRLMVLVGPDGLAEGKMFAHYGDMFWLYADNNPQAIENYLMTLTNSKRPDVMVPLYSDKPLLFYQRSQLPRLYYFEYLGYFKVQYTDHHDLQRKMNSLLNRCTQNVRAYILNDENGTLLIEELSKAEMETIGSDSSRNQHFINGPFGNPSPTQSPTHSPTPTVVYVQQPVTSLPPRPSEKVASVQAVAPLTYRPWITSAGEFILDRVGNASVKQTLLKNMFDMSVFQKYGRFGYYYLSNSEQESPIAGLQYCTMEKMHDIFHQDP